MLEKMLEMQYELQMKHYGAAPDQLEGKERVQFVKDMHIALTDELHEALAEVSWKPWAKAEYFNEDAFKGELVDAFHFFMNLMMAGHITAEDLYEGYVKKNALNAKRQLEGYDGVSTKCPGCGRALDDEAVKCTTTLCWTAQEKYHKPRPGTPDAMAFDEAIKLPTPSDYAGRLKKIMAMDPSLTRNDAKRVLYAEAYGKIPNAVIAAPAGTPLEEMTPYMDLPRPKNQAINIAVNPITPDVINRSARGLPNLFDRRDIR